jgi:hypothetical protein
MPAWCLSFWVPALHFLGCVPCSLPAPPIASTGHTQLHVQLALLQQFFCQNLLTSQVDRIGDEMLNSAPLP